MSYPLPLQSVALIGRQDSPEAADSIAALADFFRAQGVSVLVETETAIQAEQLLGKSALAGGECADFQQIGTRADLAVVVGGDGTMLHAARQLARFDRPLVGINQGRLGFMTDIARSDMIEAMGLLLADAPPRKNACCSIPRSSLVARRPVGSRKLTWHLTTW